MLKTLMIMMTLTGSPSTEPTSNYLHVANTSVISFEDPMTCTLAKALYPVEVYTQADGRDVETSIACIKGEGVDGYYVVTLSKNIAKFSVTHLAHKFVGTKADCIKERNELYSVVSKMEGFDTVIFAAKCTKLNDTRME